MWNREEHKTQVIHLDQDAREVMTRGQVNAQAYLARRRRQARVQRVKAYAVGFLRTIKNAAKVMSDAAMGRQN